MNTKKKEGMDFTLTGQDEREAVILDLSIKICQEAGDLISDYDHWTYNTFAVDGFGTPVGAQNPAAVKWCAAGAVRHEIGTLLEKIDMQDPVVESLGYESLSVYVTSQVESALDSVVQELYPQHGGIVDLNDDGRDTRGRPLPPKTRYHRVLKVFPIACKKLSSDLEHLKESAARPEVKTSEEWVTK